MRVQGLHTAVARVLCAIFIASTVLAATATAASADIVQDTNTAGTVGVSDSAGFMTNLGASGYTGTLTFTVTDPSSPTGLEVSSSGGVSTTGSLAVGSYMISGTDSDSPNSDTGTWMYTLNVTHILQGPFVSNSVSVANSVAFTSSLSAVSGYTGTVAFAASGPSTPAGLVVSSSGAISTSVPTTPLAVGMYVLTGTDSDSPNSDTGTWMYTLTVTPDNIVQGPSTANTNSVFVAGSAAFTDNLSAASGSYGSVTFSSSGATEGLVVTGNQISTTGSLDVGPHTISGTDVDTYGDTGTWSYTLTISSSTLTQTSPLVGSTTSKASDSFNPGALTASNGTGTDSFTVTTSSSALSLSGAAISTTGPLSPGSYTISGTDADAYGDTGLWSYTLDVVSVGGSTLTQSSPSAAMTSTQASDTFNPGNLMVVNGLGPVTFVTTLANANLSVSATGVIKTIGGGLIAGTYTVSGSDSDASGDTGTWTYTLTVTGVITTVTFDPNGGVRVMAPENDSTPTALTHNEFTRSGYSFVDWNTSANGSGVSYANGSVYPFGVSTTLFAQWKAGKAPSHTITFNANGGTGSTTSETDNTPTAISPDSYFRSGYTFIGWNTLASGTGTSFQAGATYPFKVSVTLFAQWRKVPPAPSFVVTFEANGGTGTMAAEHHRAPTALTHNEFTRSGYSFVDWNTAANGSGVSYANGARFAFSATVTLYAQWKIKKVVPPPPPTPPPASANEVTVGAFGLKASTLSSSLESQIQGLASRIKSKKDNQVSLLGYGDLLTPTDDHDSSLRAANVELGQQRAQAVATYLEGRLNAIGLTGWTISIAAEDGTSGARQFVVATLS